MLLCIDINWLRRILIFIQESGARTNEGVKHTTWGVWSQGGNPNH